MLGLLKHWGDEKHSEVRYNARILGIDINAVQFRTWARGYATRLMSSAFRRYEQRCSSMPYCMHSSSFLVALRRHLRSTREFWSQWKARRMWDVTSLAEERRGTHFRDIGFVYVMYQGPDWRDLEAHGEDTRRGEETRQQTA